MFDFFIKDFFNNIYQIYKYITKKIMLKLIILIVTVSFCSSLITNGLET